MPFGNAVLRIAINARHLRVRHLRIGVAPKMLDVKKKRGHRGRNKKKKKKKHKTLKDEKQDIYKNRYTMQTTIHL